MSEEEERKAHEEVRSKEDWIAQSKDELLTFTSRQRTVCFSICLVKTRP